jgi:hypothetical protein
MANYLARLELHSATYEDYETLHEAMRRRGFLRTIVGNNGNKYQLPTGTYVVEKTTATLEQAYSAAQVAATETGKSSWIIVVDWTVARFSLQQAN